MTTSDEFRSRAAHCRRQAQNEGDPIKKQMFEYFAGQWERMAVEFEALDMISCGPPEA